MAKDAELDRLKAAQDIAFQRKQDAYQVQQRAWDERSVARDAMNCAHEAKQRAYVAQDRAWKHVRNVRDCNGPQIDSFNARQKQAYEDMGRAYDASKAAYAQHDGAGASSLAAEGRRHKEESQRCVEQRRRLVAEIRTAQAELDAVKPAFQRAKGDFSACKRTFDAAKAEHERASAEFKRAKAEFDSAAKAFRSRLEKVKSEGQRRREDKKSLAAKAGVPHQYRDNVWVSTKPDGTVNIYFGGTGRPNGPGHGHYVMDANDNVTYMRDPFDPHGAHNFTGNQHDYESMVARESQSGDFGFRCRFRGYDAYVETNVNKQGRPKIDIYYGPNGPFGAGHHHAVAYRESPFNFVSDQLR